MNESVVDITRFFGAFPEILRMLADIPLMVIAGGALLFAYAWLLAYRLTGGRSGRK